MLLCHFLNGDYIFFPERLMNLSFLNKAKATNATTYARTIPSPADAKTPDASSRATLLSTMEMGMLGEAG